MRAKRYVQTAIPTTQGVGEIMNNGEQRARRFWQHKAKGYPLPYDEDTLKTTREVIEIVKSRNVELKGKRVIDIGCGTGIYTLPIAEEASFVLGLDYTLEMLNRLMEEAKRVGLNNVDTLHASWKEIDIEAAGLKGAFDVAWVAMSMAVREEAEVLKMQACATQHCVYIGWGSRRENTLMEEVFQAHDVDYGPPQGGKRMLELLKGLGKSPTYDLIETSWTWKGTIDEAIDDISANLLMHGADPDRQLIKGILSCYEKGGVVSHTTLVEEVVLTWQV